MWHHVVLNIVLWRLRCTVLHRTLTKSCHWRMTPLNRFVNILRCISLIYWSPQRSNIVWCVVPLIAEKLSRPSLVILRLYEVLMVNESDKFLIVTLKLLDELAEVLDLFWVNLQVSIETSDVSSELVVFSHYHFSVLFGTIKVTFEVVQSFIHVNERNFCACASFRLLIKLFANLLHITLLFFDAMPESSLVFFTTKL